MPFSFFFRRFQRPAPVERYVVAAVTSTAELDRADLLPPDVQFVLTKAPELRTAFHRVLKDGYGIGVRVLERTPGRVLTAVDRIAARTQGNAVIPWLPILIEKEEVPLFTREELEQAHAEGVDLYEEAQLIAEERDTFRKLVLVDLHDQQIPDHHQAVIRQANAVLAPLAVAAIVHRVVLDRSRTRPKVGETLAKAVFFIGPIAHVLERWIPGVGKVFAAVADDVLSDAAELVTLRQGGLTWRQVTRRLWTLVPLVLLAGAIAWQVEPFVRAGKLAQAGALFGVASVVLPFAELVTSVASTRATFVRLVAERKVSLAVGESTWLLALRQEFANVSRIGWFVGMILVPAFSALVFVSAGSLLRNGWLLALSAVMHVFFTSFVVALSDSVERWWFHRKTLQGL